MLSLPDDWVWDFWLATDGPTHHLFFLQAPRALGDPDKRHWSASVGHATSTDLRSWTVLPDALHPGAPGRFDDRATWTGSVVRANDGSWRMFYTGVDHARGGIVQRIAWASSRDLSTWSRPDPQPVLAPDFARYEELDRNAWMDEAWRDPWVYRGADSRWHMLVTARAADGPADTRGVIGSAVSDDLETWRVGAPLSSTDAGFGQLEVTQLADVDGRRVLLFSCLTGQLAGWRRERGDRGGIWAVNVDPRFPDGPFDVRSAYLLADESLYVGRLVWHEGRWVLLAFQNRDAEHDFVGAIIDPLEVGWVGDRLEVRRTP